MNYIELVNQFWQKDIEFNFVDKEIALYFYLLKVSNSTGWRNPFGLSNAMTIAKFSWGKTSFNNAKNRLKKAGLIDFKGGDGRGNVYQYEIKVHVKGVHGASLYDTLYDTLSDTLYKPKPATSINIKNKHKQKQVIGHPPERTKKVFVPPELKQVQDYFVSTIGNPKNQDAWPADKCFNEASACFDHYTANGWIQGRGKKIVDWKASCRTWIRNELKGVFQKPTHGPPKAESQKQVLKVAPAEPDKFQSEVNYLFDRFCEDEENVTVISAEPVHYDTLKKAGLINFNGQRITQIRKAAQLNLNGNGDETKLLAMMKRLGVLEFFKELKQQNKTVVFK